MEHRVRAAATAGLLSLLSACATPRPDKHFLEDSYARYYRSDSGAVLRVEGDGTVLDVTCLTPQFARDMPREELPASLCDDGKLTVLGKVGRAGDDWDMSAYRLARETGRCKPLLRPLTRRFEESDWKALEADQGHSCWNLLWEVPASIVAYPAAAVILVGGVTAPVWLPILLLR